MQAVFKIQDKVFSAGTEIDAGRDIPVSSSPRPYVIHFDQEQNPAANLSRAMLAEKHPLLLVDERIFSLYLEGCGDFGAVPTCIVPAREELKNIDTVLSIVDFLERERATKSSKLFVVGGGIIQDLGGFAAAIYKRGLPWAFVPTTLLGQCDSCLGGKTALNFKNTKNLLALFTAPRQVHIDTGYLATLSPGDFMSGVGECFRLCITGGSAFLDVMEKNLDGFLANDMTAIRHMIATSLTVKKEVVEFDEFELDIRRSMNYGHTFGHALEALTSFAIPHGVAVTIGILVENEISHQRNILSGAERDRVLEIGKRIIPARAREEFLKISLDNIMDLLQRDKKAEGKTLKVATLRKIGEMVFVDLELNEQGMSELRQASGKICSLI